ncbi:MAG TPA: extracellular solute-binding protein [Caldilineaceae bacterium]|nr:extracellular solute-binding protein [Caldilineaceae bacterium]
MSQESGLRRLSRRQFLQHSLVLGATVGLTSLAGCVAPGAPQAQTGAEAPPAGGSTVLFWKPPHSEREAEIWRPLLDAFQEEHPGITVEHQVVPWASVDEQFTAAFAGGSPPDIFYLPDEWYPKYVSQGQITDLTDRIAEWRENYNEAAWNIATYKGSTWGVPFLGVVQSWLLNMNLFNEKGLSAPTNWEEFRAAAQELTDTSAGVYGIDVPANSTNWVVLIPLLAAGGTTLLSEDLLSVAANTEGGRAAFKMLLEDIVWNDQSGVPVGFTDDQRRDLRLTGKVGIQWVENSSIKAQWRTEAPDIELDVIPMLQLTEDGKPADWANVGFMFVAEQSKDKTGVFDLLDYLATDEIQVEYVQKGVDLLPLKKGIPPLPDVDPIVAKMVSFLDQGYGVGTQISIRWREATNSLVQESHAVMSGQKTAEQALADVEATVNPILDGE